ncbi:MAG: hypothetical protein HY814_07410 [Candidatus Riflebacteria bacterium]|nr:hypothetical protein [Candidatus Riflebacteria bacterium]
MLVVALLATVVLGGAWFLFLSGSRQSARLDSDLRRVQSVVLVLEVLADDVAQAVIVPGDGQAGNVAGGPQLTLFRFADYRLDLQAAERDPETAGAIRTEQVTYRFDAPSGRLSRNGQRLGSEAFADVRFQPPDTFVPGVQVTLTARATGQAGGTPYTILLPVPSQGRESVFPGWQENFFDLIPVVE